MKICIVIPNYNHGTTMEPLLQLLEPYGLECIVVDDGSDAATKKHLAKVNKKFSWVSLITLPENRGKGMAMLAGFEYAHEHGFTHAIQIDADGQHDTQDIPKFVNAAIKDTHAVVTGIPVYDKTVPKERVFGRKIANFWVWVETLSFSIKDSMCGYRVYPLQEILQVMHKNNIFPRMASDIEMIVRLYWLGCNVICIPTHVTYPKDGISHFRVVKDNLIIAWMFTKLFGGFLLRFPKLLRRNFRQHKAKKTCEHWSKTKEKGSLLGMNIVLYTYKILGRKLAHLLLYPIMSYFYLTSPKAKNASRQYLQQLGQPELSSFKHFMNFAEAGLDKIVVWNDDVNLEQVEFVGGELFEKSANINRGGIILTAHLGNIEVARAIARFSPNAKINAVLFDKNAKKITRFLESINSASKMSIIPAESMSMLLAMQLQEKVEQGEFIVLMTDRTSVNATDRYINAKFLGKQAKFPEGPFVLAGMLQCPVYFMLCFSESNNKFKIYFEEFAATLDVNKNDRKANLERYVEQYAARLEYYCRQYPLQWFNFFDFWKSDE